MRLQLVPDAEAERQLLGERVVVLHVPPRLILAVFNQRAPDALLVGRGQAELVLLEAAEGPRAVAIAQLVAAVPHALQEEAGADPVLLPDLEVDVVLDLEQAAPAIALLAGATGGEVIEHDDGRVVRQRALLGEVARVLDFQLVGHLRQQQPIEREAHRVLAGRAVVRAILQIAVAHAQILPLVHLVTELDPHQLCLRQLMFDARRGEHPIVGPPHDVAVAPVGGVGVDRLAVVVGVAVHIDRQRRLALDERAVEVEAEAPVLLGPLRRRKRVARVERLVAEADVGHPAPAVHAGLGGDVDAEATAGLVVVGRVRVHAEPDRLDLRLRRQAAAAKAVDPHRGPGAGHLHQELLELVGVVGQFRDLLFAERRGEGVTGHVGRISPHDDFLGQPGQRQGHRHRVGALLHRQLPFVDLKGLGLDPHRVCADRQALDVGLPPLVDLHRPGRARLMRDGDRGGDERRASLIDHGDLQIGGAGGLILPARRRGDEQQERKQQQQSSSHYR